jgi:hypothetical protein
MAQIGSLVVDLVLKSAQFNADLAKSSKVVAANATAMRKSFDSVNRAVSGLTIGFGGLLTAKTFRAISRITSDALKLAATLEGPLQNSAKRFLEQSQQFNKVFQLGIAQGFLDAMNGSLDNTTAGLNRATEAGRLFGTVVGGVFNGVLSLVDRVATRMDTIGPKLDNLARLAFDPTLGLMSGAGSARPELPSLSQDAMNESLNKGASLANQYAGALKTVNAATAQNNIDAEIFANIVKANEKLYMDSRTPMEQYAMNLQRISDAHAQGELAARAHVQANAILAGEFLNLADTAAGALGTLFKDSKGVAIAQAVINTAQAITATLAQYGATPWGLVAAGVAAAAGAAQIATIMSAQPGSGTKPKVGGGGGGGGKKKPKESSEEAGGSQRSMTVVLQGQGGFTRDQVRGLVDQINGLAGDGLMIRTG